MKEMKRGEQNSTIPNGSLAACVVATTTINVAPPPSPNPLCRNVVSFKWKCLYTILRCPLKVKRNLTGFGTAVDLCRRLRLKQINAGL